MRAPDQKRKGETEKERNKRVSDIILEKIASGEIHTDRSSIAPKNGKEAIVKNLCNKIYDYRKANGNLTIKEMAKLCEIGETQMSLILNFHVDKVTLDSCVAVLMKLSEKDKEMRSTLLRMAVA